MQRQLPTLDLSPLLELAASDDPVLLAEARRRRSASQGRERWLREQLSRELLRSWQIEGFGDSRLMMLESHGLSNGEQLRANIDRLCSLPGFGPGREDLVLLPELLTLQNGEQQLQALGRAMATFAAAIETLQPTICDRRSAMEAQLKAFEVLC